MPLLSYTDSIIGGTPEDVSELNTMFGNVQEVVNALDDDNIAIGAGIQYAKLALAGSIKTTDLAPAAQLQIPWDRIVNPTGAVGISDAGASTIGTASGQQGFDTNISGNGSTWTDIQGLSMSLTPGFWMLFAMLNVNKGTTAGFTNAQARIVDSSATFTYSNVRAGQTTFENSEVILPMIGICGINPTTTLKVQAVCTHGGGTAVCKADVMSVLLGLKVG